ncbi:hypothetical protein [Planctomicrobium sp. SH527]|uniref:hypothetical protein n=1 Tax=Planctomicrobium sp. SH527 TaxID=3448123 RepID=UPI003F5CA33C
MGKNKHRPYRALSRCVFTWAAILNVGVGPIVTASEPAPVAPVSKLQPIPELHSPASPWQTQLTSDGSLSLQLFASSKDRSSYQPAPAMPAVLMRESSVAAAGRSNSSGTTTFSRLREGPHSFIAVGPSGFCSVGLLLAQPKMADSGGTLNIPEIALVPVTDAPVIRELLSSPAMSKTTPIGNLISDVELNGASSNQIPQFVLQSDGIIQGRLCRVERAGVRAIPDLNIAFIRNQSVVAKATSDDQGVFRCSSPSIQLGPISFVAYGSQGFAVIGAEIISAAEATNHGLLPDGTIQVVFQPASLAFQHNIMLADLSSFSVFFHSIAPFGGVPPAFVAPEVSAASGGGGAGGGAAGAGGGAGGAFGLAGLAAGITAAVVATSNDDSPPPASPATP